MIPKRSTRCTLIVLGLIIGVLFAAVILIRQSKRIEAPEACLAANNQLLIVFNISEKAETLNVYDGDRVVCNLKVTGTEMKVDVSPLLEGPHELRIVLKAEGAVDSKEVKISFDKVNLNHEGPIPKGGVYYVSVPSSKTGNYDGAKEVLVGDGRTIYFPRETNTKDVYTYGDYEYRYNESYYALSDEWMVNSQQGGWGVRVSDNSKTTYGQILEEINRQNVITLEGTFANCKSLKSLQDYFLVPRNIENVNWLFYQCEKMNSLPVTFEMPDRVKSAAWSFYACTSLKALPDGLRMSKSMRDVSYMFADCGNVTEDAMKLWMTLPDETEKVSGYFMNWADLKSLPADFRIPTGVSSLNDLFYGCISLTTPPKDFVIPEGVTSTDMMFRDCLDLTVLPKEFVLPNTLNSMKSMFEGCVSLNVIPDGFVIPESVQTVRSTFCGCVKLSGEIKFEGKPKHIEECFEGTEGEIKLSGNCSDAIKAELAKTSDKGNVKY